MLTKVQEDIVNFKGNLVVQASAGTGKTHTMVSKIEKELLENKSYKTIAAITFTIKAAEEINLRIKIDKNSMFIGTNNSFVVEEIIKPFCKDVYGKDYNLEMTTDYGLKFSTFDEGMDYIIKQSIIGTYKDSKKNFIFELAYEILLKSKACQLFLKSKYFKIYIDEYQDCDIYMHKLFMFIANDLLIDTFVVGDEKQSIYMWRGANPNSFRNIENDYKWKKMYMYDNFRSTVQIQNYSNLLLDETSHLYENQFIKGSIYYLYVNSIEWCDKVISLLDSNKKTALLRYKKKDAEIMANELTNKGFKMTYVPNAPIDEITNSTSWFYRGIAKIIIVDKYSFYDFISEIPSGIPNDKSFIKIKNILSKIKTIYKEQNELKNNILKLGEIFDFIILEDDCIKLYETVTNEKYYPAFFMEDLKSISITLHSSKGLEFDQVILFVSDYDLKVKEKIYNHYVACTRAKTKLLLVCIKNSDADKKFSYDLNNLYTSKNINVRDLIEVV